MCLIALAHGAHPRWPLVIAANRDEFYARPTRSAHAWEDAPDVFGGRDLQAGGSWLAVSASARFAAVTNIRDGRVAGGPSRGGLVMEFIKGDEAPLAYAQRVGAHARELAGFHLITGDFAEVAHVSNSLPGDLIAPGIFGVSNAPPGVEWPKVALAREALASALAHAPNAGALADELLAFLSTPRGTAIESEVFVSFPERGYGTRSSTVIVIGDDGAVHFHERNWPGGATLTATRAAGAARWQSPSPS